ncbi:MAG: transglycosylase SLT domain-containing protein [Nitrospirota bacterium]|nr:transglycosylase SLT domain-containing protein [Nitrospirota bacterium]
MKYRFVSILSLVTALAFLLIPFSVNAVPAETSRDKKIPNEYKPPKEDLSQVEEYVDGYLETKPYQIPMILNDSVENHLEYFKTRGRDVFQKWLERSARYIPAMQEIFREKNLPEDLVYVAMIESGFNPYAVSWARAVGPWQFMPHTGKLYGLKIDWWVDERKDPIKSTYAAAEHLKDLHNLFGSWPLALASYNAGAGKVQRAVLRTRSEDFWDLKASRYIRRETKNYIPKFMAATIIAKNPEAYGFVTPPVDPFTYDEVLITESSDLRVIARCAGTTYETIKGMNPELKRWVTPPDETRYILRIPKGTRDLFLTNYALVPDDQKIRWERHLVEKGDTLANIAKEYNSNPEAIKDINGLKRGRLVPGKHILIPLEVNGKTSDMGSLAPEQLGKKQQILYRVRRGDNLSRIAKKHNVTIADIRGWNNGLRTIRAGQKIKLVVDVDSI